MHRGAQDDRDTANNSNTNTNAMAETQSDAGHELHPMAEGDSQTVVVDLERQASAFRAESEAGNSQRNEISRTKTPMHLTFNDVCTYVPAELQVPGIVNTVKKLAKACAKGDAGKVPERQILHSITGVVNPGEVVAIMGPSGSGKTTFISLLAGRNHARHTGEILYNDQHKPTDKAFKRQLGYVTQEDIMFEGLTVFETLYYTAVLRLPRAMTNEDKRERVSIILEVLGIAHVKDSIVGGIRVGRRGISGGEKKRVAIGQELLYNPSVILLDEPTSGLDSTTALNLIHTLHTLAQVGNRTIVTTIHQPSSRIYQMLDKLLLMGQGHLLFYGDASAATDYFATIGYTMPYGMNPADYFLDVASGWSGEAKDCDKLTVGDPQLKALLGAIAAKPFERFKTAALESQSILKEVDLQTSRVSEEEEAEPEGASYLTQIGVICVRSMKDRRFEIFSADSLGVALFVAILCGIMWWQQGRGENIATLVGASNVAALLFFLSMFLSVNLMFSSIFTCPTEKTMLLKEREAKVYPVSAFFFGRTLAGIPIDLAIPFSVTTIIYLMAGLKPTVGAYLLTLITLVISCFTAGSLGLLIGAAVLDLKRAQSVSICIMLTLMLPSGFFIQNIPVWLSWISYLSYITYTFDALKFIQLKGRVPECPPGNEACSLLSGSQFDTLGPQIGILLLMLVVFRAGVYVSLRWAAKPK